MYAPPTDEVHLPHLHGVPRWPATVAVVAVAISYTLVSSRLRIGPRWLLPVAVLCLLVPFWTARLRGHVRLVHWLGRGSLTLITAAVASSAVFLLTRLHGDKTPATELLQNAGLIWVANIVVFALWYWEIDGGGPAVRRRESHTSHDFAFPQMQMAGQTEVAGWAPDFIDYIFLAFNTSTAFSPTDTLVLSRPAKVLLMMQSTISLVVIAVLAARAINTL